MCQNRDICVNRLESAVRGVTDLSEGNSPHPVGIPSGEGTEYLPQRRKRKTFTTNFTNGHELNEFLKLLVMLRYRR